MDCKIVLDRSDSDRFCIVFFVLLMFLGVTENVNFWFLQKSLKLLCIFVLPSFALEGIYRIWWYATGASQIHFFGNKYASYIISCTLQLSSWLYRTSIFILVCIFYRVTCYLQVLRLDDFAQYFQGETEVSSILKEHLKIRRTLRIISHRFRAFILLSLVLVTASQFIALLLTTRHSTSVNIYEAGELAVILPNLFS